MKSYGAIVIKPVIQGDSDCTAVETKIRGSDVSSPRHQWRRTIVVVSAILLVMTAIRGNGKFNPATSNREKINLLRSNHDGEEVNQEFISHDQLRIDDNSNSISTFYLLESAHDKGKDSNSEYFHEHTLVIDDDKTSTTYDLLQSFHQKEQDMNQEYFHDHQLVVDDTSSSTSDLLQSSHTKGEDVNKEYFYDDQLVNHFSTDPSASTATWSNRYYKSTRYYQGPGSPIFLVIGGEDALEIMLYPFVTEYLAPRFGAAVVEIEHRFYGPYRPIMGRPATVPELLELLTPQQAMADMIRLTNHFKEELGCSQFDRSSPSYCPVITVGGSYPGFLSAVFRLVYPDFVDISYAASAPLKLYDQTADQYVYYDIVTEAAERISKGCAHAVRSTLEDASKAMVELASVPEALRRMDMCVPDDLETTDLNSLKEDVMTAVSYAFADFDMEAYPPGKHMDFYKACKLFHKARGNSLDTITEFFKFYRALYEPTDDNDEKDACYDFYPAESEITNDDKMWDFQLCTTQVNLIGCSNSSMFIPREMTIDSLNQYCNQTYGVFPEPHVLAKKLGFDDLVGSGASRILFTNGALDMWAGGCYTENLSDSILALNFENGAHHSDLTHEGPSKKDSEDIRLGHIQIINILAMWLDEIKAESV